MAGIKNILIIMVNEMGHLFPSLQIAKILKSCRYVVTYGIQPDKIPLIKSMGFEYKVMPVFLFSTTHSYHHSSSCEFDKLVERFFNRITNYETRFTEEQLILFENAIMAVNPDMILLDSFLTPNYLLLKQKRPTILLQTMLSTYRDAQVPPLTSSLVPRSSLAKIAIWYEWKRYFLKSTIIRITHFGDTLNGITKRIARNRGIDLSGKVTWSKSFHVGLEGIQEIILAPQVFDFPTRKIRPNQVYGGLCCDTIRNEMDIDSDYDAYIDNLDKDSIIIYCSLGTLAEIHFNGVSEFYNKLINAFRFRSEVLILSTGSFDKSRIKNIPVNIRTFSRVPQISLLKRCMVFITHGGLNSVIESIMCGKPMLVFPLNSVWDQNGNAARVLYHRVGLRGSIKKISSKNIGKQITELLQNDCYKLNVERLRNTVVENKVNRKVVEKVLTIANITSHENKQMD